MVIVTIKDPKEVENRFNKICSVINRKLSNKEPIEKQLFRELESEFETVKQEYELSKDDLNLFHSSYNFYHRILNKYIESDLERAFETFLLSLKFLLKRNQLRRYGDSLSKFSEHTSINISKIKKCVFKESDTDFEKDYMPILEEVFEISKRMVPEDFELMKGVLSLSLLVYIQKFIRPRCIDSRLRTIEDLKKSEEMYEKLKLCLNIATEFFKEEDSSVFHYCYEYQYRIRKKFLQALLNKIFILKNPEKEKENMKEIIDEMTTNSQKSLRSYETFSKNKEIKNKKITLLNKFLDYKFAGYYEELYVNTNIISALRLIEEIHSEIVSKVFDDGLAVSENQLLYFLEEWVLLETFLKIILFEIELENKKKYLNKDWQNALLQRMISELSSIREKFKYDFKDANVSQFKLKIISMAFSGLFTESFIYNLLRDIFDQRKILESKVKNIEEFFEIYKNIGNIEKIYRNYKFDVKHTDRPDIDIFMEPNIGILIKNGYLSNKDIGHIWKEIRYCNENKIEKIFILINLVRNIKKVNDLYVKFEEMKKENNDIDIKVIDIKNFIQDTIKHKVIADRLDLNFSEIDLYRMIDY